MGFFFATCVSYGSSTRRNNIVDLFWLVPKETGKSWVHIFKGSNSRFILQSTYFKKLDIISWYIVGLYCIGDLFRSNCNVFGYIDWTTGLLLSDNSSEVYPEQQQSPHHHHQLTQPPMAITFSPSTEISRPPTALPSHPKIQPHQELVTSASLPLQLTPIVQLTNTSNRCTPSYTVPPTTEIVINSILQTLNIFRRNRASYWSFRQIVNDTTAESY